MRYGRRLTLAEQPVLSLYVSDIVISEAVNPPIQGDLAQPPVPLDTVRADNLSAARLLIGVEAVFRAVSRIGSFNKRP